MNWWALYMYGSGVLVVAATLIALDLSTGKRFPVWTSVVAATLYPAIALIATVASAINVFDKRVVQSIARWWGKSR